jgi:hypothetical protein
MDVALRIVCLPVAGDEADDWRFAFQDALDGKGDVAEIDGIVDLGAALRELHHGGIVHPHAKLSRGDDLLVEIERAHAQPWIAMGNRGQHVLRSGRVSVLGVVEIRNGYVVAKVARDLDELRWRGVPPLRRGIEMHVVAVKRDVAEHPDRQGGDDQGRRAEPGVPAAALDRQPQREREQQEERRCPGAEVADVGRGVLGGVGGGRAREAEREREQSRLEPCAGGSKHGAEPLSATPVRGR